MGIERAIGSINVLAHVEIEAFAALNLVSKIESGQMAPSLVFTDLKTLDYSIFRDCIDIFVGGYPCQPESAAGKRQGKKDPRHLWPHFGRAIDALRPRVCFFENVEGHVSMGLHAVLTDLESRGYETAWGIFSAEEVGQNVPDSVCDDGGKIFTEGRHPQSSEPIGNGQARGIMPDTDSLRQQQWKKFEPKGRHWFINMGQDVANTDCQRFENSQGRSGKAGKDRDGCIDTSGCDRGRHNGWSFEPNVGRVVDGCPNRVDRLRLLGNGVVPATAELAFRTLWEELQNNG